ncbi:TPA: Ger(x)C family spore germination protein [Bacillus cereus]|nr:Ger(x)C family spore germination protein [Bacillus cereus]
MLKRKVNLCITLCTLLFLTGCWDQKLLRDARLAYSISYDLTQKGRTQQTIEIVTSSSGERSSFKNEIRSATGDNVRNSSDAIKRTVTGNIRYFKNGILLLGKSIQKKGIRPYLNVDFRDPNNPTALLKAASVDGNASQILKKKKVGTILIGEFLTKKLTSLEEMSVFPQDSYEVIGRKMLDSGQDFTLPSIQFKNGEVISNGLALFNGDKVTGLLTPKQSTLFVLLTGKMGKSASLTRNLTKKSAEISNYITFELKPNGLSRNLKLKIDKQGNVHANIKLKLQVIVLETSIEHVYSKKNRKKIEKTLSKKLTKEANLIITKLQKANCDALGIGRQLIAYHPEVWKKKNWKKDYKKVKFKPEVEVSILTSGILN